MPWFEIWYNSKFFYKLRTVSKFINKFTTKWNIGNSLKQTRIIILFKINNQLIFYI